MIRIRGSKQIKIKSYQYPTLDAMKPRPRWAFAFTTHGSFSEFLADFYNGQNVVFASHPDIQRGHQEDTDD